MLCFCAVTPAARGGGRGTPPKPLSLAFRSRPAASATHVSAAHAQRQAEGGLSPAEAKSGLRSSPGGSAAPGR